MKISCVMPARNTAPFLGRSISSVLSQTHRDFELIIVDDCSDDGSFDVASGYAASDKRVRVLRQREPRGTWAARQAGVADARTDIITFLDSDDWIHPEKFEIQARTMAARPDLAAVSTQYTMVFERAGGDPVEQPVVNPTERGAMWDFLPFANPFLIAAAMIRRGVFQKEDTFHGRMAIEDYCLTVSLLRNGYAIANVPERLYFYRRHGNSKSDRREMDVYRAAENQEVLSMRLGRPVSNASLPGDLRGEAERLLKKYAVGPGKDVYIWGTGSCGRRLIELLRVLFSVSPSGLVDSDPTRRGGDVQGVPVLDPDSIRDAVLSGRAVCLLASVAWGALMERWMAWGAKPYEDVFDFSRVIWALERPPVLAS